MYDNATKNTWRGWAWNQVQSRVKPGSRVLVLCGDVAGDVEHGIRRGFETVGIDTASKPVKTFRDSGGIAIQDDLLTQMWLLKPDAVIADMKGGFNRTNFFNLIFPLFRLKAFVWNGLRGREKNIGLLSKAVDFLPRVPEYKRGRFLGFTDTRKHRGKMAFNFLLSMKWAQEFELKHYGHNSGNSFWDIPRSITVESSRFLKQFADVASLEFANHLKPEYYSYQSKDSSQYFDSIAATGLDCWNKLIADIPHVQADDSSKRKAAAAKALLTMQRQRN